MAHRKNKLVTRTNGTTYFLSVRGVDWSVIFSSRLLPCAGLPVTVRRLGQSSIQMHISAIHKPVLSGDVARFPRQQENRDAGYLRRFRHPRAERNLGNDVLQLLVGIWKRAQPLPVKRSHDLGRNDGVYPDAIGKQFSRPFTRQRQDRALRGSVS